MKIKLLYMNLTVEIEAKGLDASIDAIMISSAIINETRKIHYGNPQVEMNTEDLKVDPSPKP